MARTLINGFDETLPEDGRTGAPVGRPRELEDRYGTARRKEVEAEW